MLWGVRSAGAVDEGVAALHVDAEDAFAGRLEQLRKPVAPDGLFRAGQVQASGAGEGGVFKHAWV